MICVTAEPLGPHKIFGWFLYLDDLCYICDICSHPLLVTLAFDMCARRTISTQWVRARRLRASKECGYKRMYVCDKSGSRLNQRRRRLTKPFFWIKVSLMVCLFSTKREVAIGDGGLGNNAPGRRCERPNNPGRPNDRRRRPHPNPNHPNRDHPNPTPNPTERSMILLYVHFALLCLNFVWHSIHTRKHIVITYNSNNSTTARQQQQQCWYQYHIYSAVCILWYFRATHILFVYSSM